MGLGNITSGGTSRREVLKNTVFSAGAAAVSFAVGSHSAVAQQAQPSSPQSVAELTRIAEDVYMWRSLTHNTMFIVTDEGVIAADPIGLTNPRSPQMYKAAIAAVTDRPVKYLILTKVSGFTAVSRELMWPTRRSRTG